jgi:hypothetical protein
MKAIRVWAVLGICLIAVAAQAQSSSRKPGLYEVTSQMSMSGGPSNMPAMPARTTQVCVTQAMIDKYGGPTTTPQTGQCQMTNVSLTASGMTANISCTGRTAMTGTVQMTFVDANTSKTTINMTMAMGANTMNMSMQATASYKGADCGSVQPMAMPASK